MRKEKEKEREGIGGEGKVKEEGRKGEWEGRGRLRCAGSINRQVTSHFSAGDSFCLWWEPDKWTR